MSLPNSSPVSPAASAAADPPDEPPAPRVTSHGLFVVPYTALYDWKSARDIGTLVLPKITAPAARSRATATASWPAMLSANAGKPNVVGCPGMLKLSLTVIGTPCSGPTLPPLASARSAARASFNARSRSSTTMALIAGLSRSTALQVGAQQLRPPTPGRSARRGRAAPPTRTGTRTTTATAFDTLATRSSRVTAAPSSARARPSCRAIGADVRRTGSIGRPRELGGRGDDRAGVVARLRRMWDMKVWSKRIARRWPPRLVAIGLVVGAGERPCDDQHARRGHAGLVRQGRLQRAQRARRRRHGEARGAVPRRTTRWPSCPCSRCPAGTSDDDAHSSTRRCRARAERDRRGGRHDHVDGHGRHPDRARAVRAVLGVGRTDADRRRRRSASRRSRPTRAARRSPGSTSRPAAPRPSTRPRRCSSSPRDGAASSGELDDDSSSDTLAIVALVVGALGLVAGGAALVLSRRRGRPGRLNVGVDGRRGRDVSAVAVNRTAARGGGGPGARCRRGGRVATAAGRRASLVATVMASATTANQGSHVVPRLRSARGTTAAFAPAGTSSNASISIRTSPISRRRFFESFERHRTSKRRMDAGVVAGSADQSGSRSRILAIESETVSPANAMRPVNISYRTQPKAQMSVRLSTGNPRACSGLM